MNFQNIEYFVAVVEHGNFTRAAQSLYISQQSLSENIRRLEEEIGTPLLNRGRTLTLTPAGECFLSGGRKILSTQDKMLREIAILSNTCRSKILLQTPPEDIPPFLPVTLSKFTQNYPEYEVVVNPVDTEKIPDFSFSFENPGKNMESILLIEQDPFAAVIDRSLAARILGDNWPCVEEELLSCGKLSVFQNMPFLLLYRNHHLHPHLETIFADAGFTPKDALKSEDAGLLSSICANGNGVFLGPQDYCSRKFGPLLDKQTGSLAFFPLQTPVRIDLSLIYPRGKHLNKAEKCFVSTLKSVITE